MRSAQALRVLADVTANQWGMVTSAQASQQGVSRLDLSRLAEAGHLTRLAHGVYKDAGGPASQFDDLRAAWLSTDPKRPAAERLAERENGVVVAGPSAARLHRIGDLWERRFDFVTPTRRQTQRSEIRYRLRQLEPQDVTLVEGLPTMSVECTIADLFTAEADVSQIADALRDASSARSLDIERLETLLAPHAQPAGLRRGDGAGLLNHLSAIAGIDADSLAERIAAAPGLGERVTARYLDRLADVTPDQFDAIKAAVKALAENIPVVPTLPNSATLALLPGLRAIVTALQSQRPVDMNRLAADLREFADVQRRQTNPDIPEQSPLVPSRGDTPND